MLQEIDTYLKMTTKLTPEEMDKFEITDSLGINNFNGYCYKLQITPVKGCYYTYEDLEELRKNHPDDIETRDVLSDGMVQKQYYAIYRRDIPTVYIPTGSFFNKRKQRIEIMIQDGPYFGIYVIGLELDPFLGTLHSLKTIFEGSDSNSKYREALPFISEFSATSSNTGEVDRSYKITLYNINGHSKVFEYPDYSSIYSRIVSARIIGE